MTFLMSFLQSEKLSTIHPKFRISDEVLVSLSEIVQDGQLTKFSKSEIGNEIYRSKDESLVLQHIKFNRKKPVAAYFALKQSRGTRYVKVTSALDMESKFTEFERTLELGVDEFYR